jgi:hypothetical protein
MVKQFLLSLVICIGMVCTAAAQDNVKKTLYTGMIDDKIPVSMFLTASEHPCSGDTVYDAIYKYDRVANDKWLLLKIDCNDKGQFVMVEVKFSGVMILKKDKASGAFDGIWISPDGKTQKKVTLQPKKASKAEIDKLYDKLDQVNHDYYDC